MIDETEIVYEGYTIKVRMITKIKDRWGVTHYYQSISDGKNFAKVADEIYQWDSWTHLARQAGFTDADWMHQAVAEALAQLADSPAFAEFGKGVQFH